MKENNFTWLGDDVFAGAFDAVAQTIDIYVGIVSGLEAKGFSHEEATQLLLATLNMASNVGRSDFE